MNCVTRISIVIATLAALFGTQAFAAEPGFYIGASLGRGEENPGRSLGTNFGIGLSPPTIQHIDPFRVDVDSDAVAWGVALGYRMNRHIAAELEYIDFGSARIAEHYDLSGIIPTLPVIPALPGLPGTPVLFAPAELTRTYSSRVKGPALSLLGSLSVGKSWDVFLRGGVLFADRKVDIGPSIGVGNNTFGSTVWLAGAGVHWSLTDRWTFRAEYQRTDKLGRSLLASETELERMSLSVLFKL